MTSATQGWTHDLPIMQQSVLLSAVRGPDGISKYSSIKMLLRWYRRCILVSAIDQKILIDPYQKGGGSFTGPSIPDSGGWEWEKEMDEIFNQVLREVDSYPHHFWLHFMHATEILGYKHPYCRTRSWWNHIYLTIVNDMHLHPETMEEMDHRLGDTREGWLARSHPATSE